MLSMFIGLVFYKWLEVGFFGMLGWLMIVYRSGIFFRDLYSYRFNVYFERSVIVGIWRDLLI